jgi:hypothetical protein
MGDPKRRFVDSKGAGRGAGLQEPDVLRGGGLIVGARIDIDRSEIEGFCRRNRIRRLALFGSVLREDFTADSDVDVLMEFEPDARVGLITLAGMENELSGLIGRRVDLNTAGCLSPHFRDEVLREAEGLHEQA